MDCGAVLAAPAGQRCATTTGTNGALRLRGTVLSAVEVFEGGDVLIDEDGWIVCVGCGCGEHPLASDATTVTCPSGVISPALINAHDHITFTQNPPADWGEVRYDHRHEWRRGLNDKPQINTPGNATVRQRIWGELRQVMGGTVAMAGSDGSARDRLIRNLDSANGLLGLPIADVDYDTFPLGDSGGQLRTQTCSYPGVPGESVLNTGCWLPHVSEGINAAARNEFLCISEDERGGRNLLAPNVAIIHGVGLTAMDAVALAHNRTAVVWSPRTNIALYGNTAPVTLLRTVGVLIGLGTDWTRTGSINMLRELACADLLNREYFAGTFSDRELWLMATSNNAVALGVGQVVGFLRPGRVGDVAIFDGEGRANPYRAILEAGVEDVLLTARGGQVLYGDLNVIEGLPDFASGCEAMPEDICGVAKGICVRREIGVSFATLAGSVGGAYGAFFCGVPDDEPTCIPSRPGEYDGVRRPTDLSGDGVPNLVDNCPTIFNPVRPMDDGVQADWDGDGVGDACDPCPIGRDAAGRCFVVDPFDSSGDGIPDAVDNCLYAFNPDQIDSSGDGVGDACAPCPREFNPLFGPCAFNTIVDIKSGRLRPGAQARVTGVVTAVRGRSFFLQMSPDDPFHEGVENSGLFVFVPAANPAGLDEVAEGDAVEVAGRVGAFFGQLQLQDVTSIDPVEEGMAMPEPVVLAPADIATGGPLAEAYEGTLVRVEEVEVTAVNPPPGGGQSAPTGEFIVEGSLRIGRYMMVHDPLPEVGSRRTSITGALRFANDHSKLEPRRAEDIVP